MTPRELPLAVSPDREPVNQVEAALTRAVGDLVAVGLRWAVVGGFAVSARAEPRFTRDVDVAVAVSDDAGAENAVRALGARGYRIAAAVEQVATSRLATVRLEPVLPGSGLVLLDLLFASSGIEAEIVACAEQLEILPALVVPVARPGHLIAVKLLARDDRTRPQDAADLRALRQVSTQEDLALAEVAVRLIAERGYARGRDLEAALDAFVTGPL